MNEYYSYDFDGTNKCVEWYKYHNYYSSSGWHDNTDYPDFTRFEYEIEVNSSKTQFRKKLWKNEYSTWGAWLPYEFRDNGNTLRIYDFPDISPDSYKDYRK